MMSAWVDPPFTIILGDPSNNPIVFDRDTTGKYIRKFVYEAEAGEIPKLTVEFSGVYEFTADPGSASGCDLELDPSLERILLNLGWTPPPDGHVVTQSPWESLLSGMNDDDDD